MTRKQIRMLLKKDPQIRSGNIILIINFLTLSVIGGVFLFVSKPIGVAIIVVALADAVLSCILMMIRYFLAIRKIKKSEAISSSEIEEKKDTPHKEMGEMHVDIAEKKKKSEDITESSEGSDSKDEDSFDGRIILKR